MNSALNVCEAKARFDAPERAIHIRVGGANGSIFLDLGDRAPRDKNWRPYTPKGKIWMYEPEWGCCTAVTRRWRSGCHTIPASTELMDLRTSRFKDGIIIHYDYAQQELRVLARL
jgi:hypothetical protein